MPLDPKFQVTGGGSGGFVPLTSAVVTDVFSSNTFTNGVALPVDAPTNSGGIIPITATWLLMRAALSGTVAVASFDQFRLDFTQGGQLGEVYGLPFTWSGLAGQVIQCDLLICVPCPNSDGKFEFIPQGWNAGVSRGITLRALGYSTTALEP